MEVSESISSNRCGVGTYPPSTAHDTPLGMGPRRSGRKWEWALGGIGLRGMGLERDHAEYVRVGGK